MGYIRGFFSKKKSEGTEKKDKEILAGNRFARFLKDRFGIKTMFSKFFVLFGIAVIIGIVSFKYIKGQALKNGIFSKTADKGVLNIQQAENNLGKMREGRVKIGEESFLVRVAENKREWKTGLMWVKRMKADKGMLFDFKKPVDYGFWMKNTLIPLSILFVGKDMRINGAVNMEPCRMKTVPICPQFVPEKKYIYVLEINHRKDVSKYIGKKLYLT